GDQRVHYSEPAGREAEQLLAEQAVEQQAVIAPGTNGDPNYPLDDYPLVRDAGEPSAKDRNKKKRRTKTDAGTDTRALAHRPAAEMDWWHSLCGPSRTFGSRRSVVTIWPRDCSHIPGSPSFGGRRNVAKVFGRLISVCTLRLAGITAAIRCSRHR